MNNDQPPLPHPVTNALMGDDFEDLYTADQMREYGRACERAAYERAVKKCEEFEDELQTKGRDREADVALGLARRIEALGADK